MGPIRRESRGRSSGTKSPSSTFVYEKDGSNSIDLMEVEKENGHEIGSISKDTPSSSSARKAGRKSLSAASASSVNIAANTSPSSSTNPNVTSISLSSSSPVKKSQQRRVHKYASKYVDSMMEGIMDDIVKNAKHPVATKKWLSKLRASVLKRVSHASQRLYLTPEHDVHELDRKIQATQEEIRAKTLHLQELALMQIQKSRLAALPPLPEVRSNTFIEEKVQSIREKIGRISQQVSSTSKNMEERAGSFAQTLAVVNANIDAVLERAASLKVPLAPVPTSSHHDSAPSPALMISIANTQASSTGNSNGYEESGNNYYNNTSGSSNSSTDSLVDGVSASNSNNTNHSVRYQVPQPSYTTAGGNRVMATPREPMQQLRDHLAPK